MRVVYKVAKINNKQERSGAGVTLEFIILLQERGSEDTVVFV